MSFLRAISAAESAVLIASIDDPTMIALYLWVVSGIALKAARFAVGHVHLVRPSGRARVRERLRDVAP